MSDFLEEIVLLNDKINVLNYDIQEYKEKIEVYEKLLHDLDLSILCNSDRATKLISLVQKWSYAHRAGNGEKSDEEIEHAVEQAFLAIKEEVCL